MRRTSADPIAVWMGLMGLVMDHKALAPALLQEASGMPWSRYRVLRRVEDRALSQRELADALHVDAPAMSGIVNDLVRRGYVARIPHADDARMRLVTITDAGRQLMERLRHLPDVVPAPVASLTAAERRELARLIDKMREAADA